jgi:hypothetical protein
MPIELGTSINRQSYRYDSSIILPSSTWPDATVTAARDAA